MDGFATGSEGKITYDIQPVAGQSEGTAHFHWDNPFIGPNSFDEATKVKCGADEYEISVTNLCYGDADFRYQEGRQSHKPQRITVRSPGTGFCR